MLYSLTDKLKFNTDPQIEIKGEVITVKSDAETVLQLLDVVRNKGEIDGAIMVMDILLNEKDRKTVKSLGLKMGDYVKLTSVMVDLALGNDPDADKGEE